MKGGKRGEGREKRGGEKTRTACLLGYWHGFFLVLAAVERHLKKCVTQAARERPFKKLLFNFRT